MNIDKTFHIIINLNNKKIKKEFLKLLLKICKNDIFKIFGKIMIVNF